MNEFIIEMGDFKIKIKGKTYLTDGIKNELKNLIKKKDNSLDCTFELNSSNNLNSYYNPHYIYINRGSYLYPTLAIKVETQKNFKIFVDEKHYKYGERNIKNYLFNLIWMWYDRSWMSLQEVLTYSLINGVLEPIGVLFFPEKLPLIHAAGFCYKGKGYLISGEGGVGKTTTSLKLLIKNRDVFYMTDDMAIVDNKGYLYYYPRNMIVYQYNIRDIPELMSLLKNTQTIMDRIHWYFHKSENRRKMSRRRLPPEQFLGKDKIGPSKVPLKMIIFLEKANVNDITFESWSVQKFSSIMSDIIINKEFKKFALQCFNKKYFNLDKRTWFSKYKKSLIDRLQNVEIMHIVMPYKADYSIVEDIILSNIR